MYEWLFRRFRECVSSAGFGLWQFTGPSRTSHFILPNILRSNRLTRAAGLELIDLSGVFDTVVDRNSLVLAKWDDHTNARGHRMLADALFERLAPAVLEHRAADSRSATDVRNSETAAGHDSHKPKESHEFSGDPSHN